MAEEFNHECIICHRRYWSCDKCSELHSWRSITCSPECFQKYLQILDERQNPKPITEVVEKTSVVESALIEPVNKDNTKRAKLEL